MSFLYNSDFENHMGSIDFNLLRTLQVPQELHDEYMKGGSSRQRLTDLFSQCGLDKARSIEKK